MFAAIREAVRDRARRHPEAARLPDPQPRRRVRQRAGKARRAPSSEPSAVAGARGRGQPVRVRAAGTFSPQRVPVPSCGPPLERCAPTGVSLEAGTRVILMPDAGGVGAGAGSAARRARRRGARRRRRAGRRRARESDRGLDGSGARCTASTGCRRSTTRARSTTLDPEGWREGAARPREAARSHHARAGRRRRGPGTFLVTGYAPRRPPRLRRRRRDRRSWAAR